MKGSEIDWDRINRMTTRGDEFDALLSEIPQKMWMSCRKDCMTTLLHFAAECNNTKAMKRLLKFGFHPNTVDRRGCDAAYLTICYQRPNNLLLLVCAGLDQARSKSLYLAYLGYCNECGKVLITNGFWNPPECVLPQFEELRQSFVTFRSCIITMIGIKRFRRQLYNVDRFLIRLIALEIWAARTEM